MLSRRLRILYIWNPLHQNWPFGEYRYKARKRPGRVCRFANADAGSLCVATLAGGRVGGGWVGGGVDCGWTAMPVRSYKLHETTKCHVHWRASLHVLVASASSQIDLPGTGSGVWVA